MHKNNTSTTRSEWRTPTTIISFVGLIISLLVNIYQFYDNNKNLQFEKDKYYTEIRIKNAEIERLKKQDSSEAAKLERINIELKQINKDLKVWENSYDEFQLEKQKRQTQCNFGNQDVETLKMCADILKMIDDNLVDLNQKITSLKDRRRELEAQQ